MSVTLQEQVVLISMSTSLKGTAVKKKNALKARKQILKIESSVLPFPLRAEFQEETSQISVASLCADKVTEASHLLPVTFYSAEHQPCQLL